LRAQRQARREVTDLRSAANRGNSRFPFGVAEQVNVILNGQLTLRGVTRGQKVPAMLVATGDMLHAFGEFSLRQTDYHIQPVSAVGGGLKVKDEVKFEFDIVARKQN
jgi:hypothetical protein